MRRQQRYVYNAAGLFAVTSAIVDIIYQWKQLKQKGIEFTWNNYNGVQTLRNSLYGGLLGAAVGHGYYKYTLLKEEEAPFDADNYLLKVISAESLKSNKTLLQSVLTYRDKVKVWLSTQFGHQLVGKPGDAGSFIKRTANASNHDLDIILPFRKSSFATLEEMYEHTFESINRAFSKNATVTRQKRAIGVTFESGDFPIHFDIIPGREINNYIEDKDLNLFVNASWVWEKGKSFKINTGVQRNMTINNPDARKVIRLLKLYRDLNHLHIPSIIIEHSVVCAFSKKIYASVCENLLYAMDHLVGDLYKSALIDLGNTNNNILSKMSEHERYKVSRLLLHDIESVEANPRFLKEMFEC